MSAGVEVPAPEEVGAPTDVRRWKLYPACKDSGVSWLGIIPAHWDVQPLKHIAESVSRGNSPEYVDESAISVVNQACIHWDGLRLEGVKYQADSDVSSWKGLLRLGDVLINATGTGTLGRTAVFSQPGVHVADSHVMIVRVPRERTDERFITYLLRTPTYQGYIYSSLVAGATNQIELSREGLRATPFIVPPTAEQRAIADFLDRETRKIDALAAKKRRQIELLQEKRAALISHAVTRGLDPSAPMRDSGVPWLGEVPTHWQVKRLKNSVTRCQNGVWGDEPTGGENDIVCIRVADFDRVRFRVSDKKLTIRSVGPAQRQGNQLDPGDLLLEKSGGGESQPVGVVMLYDLGVPAVCSNFVSRMVVAAGYNPGFLCYLHASLYAARLNRCSIKQNTGIQNLDSDAYLGERVGFPPSDEQRAIAEFLDWETAKIDRLIGKVRRHIEVLGEYRTALISAAVTGKIDVRGEVGGEVA